MKRTNGAEGRKLEVLVVNTDEYSVCTERAPQNDLILFLRLDPDLSLLRQTATPCGHILTLHTPLLWDTTLVMIMERLFEAGGRGLEVTLGLTLGF